MKFLRIIFSAISGTVGVALLFYGWRMTQLQKQLLRPAKTIAMVYIKIFVLLIIAGWIFCCN